MNIYYAIPSCNLPRARGCLTAWKTMGYKTALFTEQPVNGLDVDRLHFNVGKFPGYWAASNFLAKLLVDMHDADIVIFGGDDLYPDTDHKPQDIGADFYKTFPDGFGVMQPTGDLFMQDEHGVPASARICGSPWFGREWIKRAYNGVGPTWPGYKSFYGDEDLQHVALKLRKLWQRPDLNQPHLHWSRNEEGCGVRQDYQKDNNARYWKKDKELFDMRLKFGFPDHEPLEA